MRKAEPYQPRQPGPGADRGPEIVKGPRQEPLRAAPAKELELERGEKEDTVPLAYDESLVENTVEDPRESDDFEHEGTVAHEMEEEVDTQEPKLLRRSRRVRRKNTMYDEGMWCMDQE